MPIDNNMFGDVDVASLLQGAASFVGSGRGGNAGQQMMMAMMMNNSVSGGSRRLTDFGPGFYSHANPGFGSIYGGNSTWDSDILRAQSANFNATQQYLNMTDPRARVVANKVLNMKNPGANTLGGLGFLMNGVGPVSDFMGGSLGGFAMASQYAMNGPIRVTPQPGTNYGYNPTSYPTSHSQAYQQAAADAMRTGFVDKRGFSAVSGLNLTEAGNVSAMLSSRGYYSQSPFGFEVGSEKNAQGKSMMKVKVDQETQKRIEETNVAAGELARTVKEIFGPDGLVGNIDAILRNLGGSGQSISTATSNLKSVVSNARAVGRDERGALEMTMQMNASLQRMGITAGSASTIAAVATSAGLANSMTGGVAGVDRQSDQQVALRQAQMMAEAQRDESVKETFTKALFKSTGMDVGEQGVAGIISKMSNGDKSKEEYYWNIYRRDGGLALMNAGNEAGDYTTTEAQRQKGMLDATSGTMMEQLNEAMINRDAAAWTSMNATGGIKGLFETGAFKGANRGLLSKVLAGNATEAEKKALRDATGNRKFGDKDAVEWAAELLKTPGASGNLMYMMDEFGTTLGTYTSQQDYADMEERKKHIRTAQKLAPSTAKNMPFGQKLLEGFLDETSDEAFYAQKKKFEQQMIEDPNSVPWAIRQMYEGGGATILEENGVSTGANIEGIAAVKRRFMDDKVKAEDISGNLGRIIGESGSTEKSKWEQRLKDAGGDKKKLMSLFGDIYRNGSEVERTGLFNYMTDMGINVFQMEKDGVQQFGIVSEKDEFTNPEAYQAEAKKNHRKANARYADIVLQQASNLRGGLASDGTTALNKNGEGVDKAAEAVRLEQMKKAINEDEMLKGGDYDADAAYKSAVAIADSAKRSGIDIDKLRQSAMSDAPGSTSDVLSQLTDHTSTLTREQRLMLTKTLQEQENSFGTAEDDDLTKELDRDIEKSDADVSAARKKLREAAALDAEYARAGDRHAEGDRVIFQNKRLDWKEFSSGRDKSREDLKKAEEDLEKLEKHRANAVNLRNDLAGSEEDKPMHIIINGVLRKLDDDRVEIQAST